MTAGLLSLVHGDARAAIASLGAEVRAWSVGGVELLWPSDPAIWNQISPILYPVVGWTRDGARVGGKQYALGLHGFAAKQEFQVESPYACGLHPGFNWPFAGGAREGAIVRFEKDERPDVPVIAPGGLISKSMRPIPLRGRELALSDALFSGDAVCFLDPASRSLRFEQSDGAAIEMDFHGFDHVALWTRRGAPFLCLEAWTGYSDPEGFTGDLFEKPSMRVLQAGEQARHAATYEFCSTS
jgi:galactose mutarotase-like enzyme